MAQSIPNRMNGWFKVLVVSIPMAIGGIAAFTRVQARTEDNRAAIAEVKATKADRELVAEQVRQLREQVADANRKLDVLIQRGRP